MKSGTDTRYIIGLHTEMLTHIKVLYKYLKMPKGSNFSNMVVLDKGSWPDRIKGGDKN